MKTIALAVLASMLLASATVVESAGGVFSEIGTHSPDGRFGTRCFQPAGEAENVEQCEVSFYQLIAAPRQYHTRRVKVIGFLAEVFDRYVLYPNQASHDLGIEIEGIELMDAEDIPAELREAAKKGRSGVIVVGAFDAHYSGMRVPRLGAIRELKFAAESKSMPARTNEW